MANILQAIMERIERTRKTSHAWRRQVPFPQPIHSFSEKTGLWEADGTQLRLAQSSKDISHVTVLSWNVDFMLPLADVRMTAALDHLHSIVHDLDRPGIILLQEMIESDLKLMQAQPWIRSSFMVTDLTSAYWESGYYGTCTLVDKRLAISSVFRVHYEATAMERDALFVDITLRGGKTLRICNTHLESLIANPPKRPDQLETASHYMHATDMHASILGGDLNAIEDFDKSLHTDNNLKDAYLENGGIEGAEAGQTWGQMARTKVRTMYGLSRMDKLFYCGGLHLESFQTFGYGVEAADQHSRDILKAQGLDAGWITDHLGVRGDFSLQKD